MAEVKEITIRLDDSFTASVCDYSVGFLKLKKDGKAEIAEPAAAGTFVKLDRVYGILTAGHVLKELDPKSTVGLVRFPSVQPPIQNRRLDLEHTERIIDWNGKDTDAPDIAFFKIPELEGRALEAAGAVFYNPALPREFKPSKPEHRMSVCAQPPAAIKNPACSPRSAIPRIDDHLLSRQIRQEERWRHRFSGGFSGGSKWHRK